VRDGEELVASSLGGSKHARSGYAFDEIIQECFIATPSVVVRRQCLDEVGVFDESLNSVEDRDLWLRISYRWNVALVPKSLVTVRKRPSSLSSDSTVASRSRIYVFQKALAAWPEMSARSRTLVRKQLSKCYFDLGYYFYDRMMQQDARRNLLCSLRQNWWNGRSFLYLCASYFPPKMLKIVRVIKRAMS
jgi:hypothetical protein